MKKAFVLVCCGAAALLFLCASPVAAQEVVFNGDFETNSYTSLWSLFGGNQYTTIATYQTVYGVNSLCLKRRPGNPNSNGGIEQEVHLLGGITYNFSASIAATETG
jgi:hypothetical protein